eukprot:CAMPEP_0117651702 /NCGR_PEP_ID=MMETSP0804-20121206/2236_1 /TAXON_ID=1074897 /ORGANISM="Tetraselmis astigmatica, Strain CCMP880" /LENGTH=536 /DNA_ID=CAMNT_0005457703 /DNA_START=621 /DNA_END=2231 /DNA_ORIENTATION=-
MRVMTSRRSPAYERRPYGAPLLLLHLFLFLLLPLLLLPPPTQATLASQSSCTADDLARAHQRIPRDAWRGSDFAHMSQVLTAKLSNAGHLVRPCEEWSVKELKDLQKLVFSLSDPALLAVYDEVGEPRRQRFASLTELEAHWQKLEAGGVAASSPSTGWEVRRDGLCHEAVMWFVHHLNSDTQRRLVSLGHNLPSLPMHSHSSLVPPEEEAGEVGGIGAGGGSGEDAAIRAEYAQQVSCQQCHTGTITDPHWADASLPPPLPVDKSHPGRERLRSCDFQARPPCGPCEGLGGARWGDGPEDMIPMPCEPIHGPEAPPRTRGRYPELAAASMFFETRSPVAVRPAEGGEKAQYVSFPGTSLSMGWAGGAMRMRYAMRERFAALYLQTAEQAARMDPGVSVYITPRGCSCDRSIAGVMHAWSFDAEDPLDPFSLPAESGGAAYLGRVAVQLDGPQSRNATADHFMKWAFHFLVDADNGSPTFGLPLRLYAPWGVRQVFESWILGDPAERDPDVWRIPDDCNILAPGCSLLTEEAITVE